MTDVVHVHLHNETINHNTTENVSINIPDPFCSCDHRFSLHYPKCSFQNCNCKRFVSAGQANSLPSQSSIRAGGVSK